MEKAQKPALNSTKLHGGDNSKKKILKTKTLAQKGAILRKTRGSYSQQGFRTRNMDSSGQNKEWQAPNPNAPVLFTMAQPEGKKASHEDKSGKKMKGKADGATLKGKVHQWSGVGVTGKATDGENNNPLQHTMEAYVKE